MRIRLNLDLRVQSHGRIIFRVRNALAESLILRLGLVKCCVGDFEASRSPIWDYG